MAKRPPAVISLFSGALGLDLGLERAGMHVAVAVECNRAAVATIKRNRPDLTVIPKKLELVPTADILAAAGLKPGEATVVSGGPSCQPFSTAGRRGSIEDPRGVMFREFLRVVREAQPEFFVMENVRGVLSAAMKHRPLRERGPAFPPLGPEEELGSAFLMIAEELCALGYYTVFSVLNAADYGVCQVRERVVFVGSRDGKPFRMPTPTHHRKGAGGRRVWLTLEEGLKHLVDPNPTFTPLSPSKRRYLDRVPAGANWRALPTELQREALGGAYDSWGGRAGFLRRLAWDQTPPALTTNPCSKATMLCHPDETRPLSIREYLRLQGFPDGWDLGGGPPSQYMQAGNAVPVELGHVVGQEILRARKRHRRLDLLGLVACADDSLRERLAERPRTFLNPRRMRGEECDGAAIGWQSGGKRGNRRVEVLDQVASQKDVERRRPEPEKAETEATAAVALAA